MTSQVTGFDQSEVALWEARTRWYGLFSTLFAIPPRTAWFTSLLALPMEQVLESLDPSLTREWHTLRQELTADGTLEQSFLQRLTDEFQQRFAIPKQGAFVPLSASAYLPPESCPPERRAWFDAVYADLGFDWRASLAREDGVWPIEPEHLVLVLTVLSIIADDIATHLKDTSCSAIHTLSDLQLLGQEIVSRSGAWLVPCLERIAVTTPEPFYRFFAQLTESFFVQDSPLWS